MGWDVKVCTVYSKDGSRSTYMIATDIKEEKGIAASMQPQVIIHRPREFWICRQGKTRITVKWDPFVGLLNGRRMDLTSL